MSIHARNCCSRIAHPSAAWPDDAQHPMCAPYMSARCFSNECGSFRENTTSFPQASPPFRHLVICFLSLLFHVLAMFSARRTLFNRGAHILPQSHCLLNLPGCTLPMFSSMPSSPLTTSDPLSISTHTRQSNTSLAPHTSIPPFIRLHPSRLSPSPVQKYTNLTGERGFSLPKTLLIIPTHGFSPALFGRRTRSFGSGGNRGATAIFVVVVLGFGGIFLERVC